MYVTYPYIEKSLLIVSLPSYVQKVLPGCRIAVVTIESRSSITMFFVSISKQWLHCSNSCKMK